MSLTLKGITKITTEGTLLLQDAGYHAGFKMQTLSGRSLATNLTVGTTHKTQGMVSNL